MQLVHHRQCGGGIVHGGTLRQLQLQPAGWQASLFQAAGHHLGQLGVPELHGGNVHGNGPQGQVQIQPAFGVPHRCVDDPFANCHDHAAALGHGDELGWRHQAQFGMAPAQQGFGTHHLARGERDLRLVVQLKLVALQRTAQRIFDLEGTGGAGFKIGGEESVPVASVLLGTVHGGVCPLVQRVERFPVGRVHRNADRQGGGEFVGVNLEGLGHGGQQLRGHVGGGSGGSGGEQ